ncbi:50S ribosomal protein L40e [Candidatus Woesearchaeota archaeon]|nr:50S ribosomal protein L40e [Candidatus Woesearchaeota archaeon]
MAKFAEAEARRFHNTFVCRICKSKMKAPNMKVMQGKVSCRKCGSNKLRTVKKK